MLCLHISNNTQIKVRNLPNTEATAIAWNGPISSCFCDVTIIGTSLVNQPRGHWLDFCRITQMRKCKLAIWTLFQLLSLIPVARCILSWLVQNFVVIDWVHLWAHFKFWSTFKLNQNVVSGTGAWNAVGPPRPGTQACHPVAGSSQAQHEEWLVGFKAFECTNMPEAECLSVAT